MIKRLEREKIFENRWITLFGDLVRFPSGYEGEYSVIEKANFSLVIPIIGDKFVLVKVYRYPIGEYSWEFVMGANESQPDMDAGELAADELREETGYVAKSLEFLSELTVANALLTQKFSVFVAQNLTAGETSHEKTEDIEEVRLFGREELEEMIVSGELFDGPSVAAYGLFRLKYPNG